jgi:hypothetical protein
LLAKCGAEHKDQSEVSNQCRHTHTSVSTKHLWRLTNHSLSFLSIHHSLPFLSKWFAAVCNYRIKTLHRNLNCNCKKKKKASVYSPRGLSKHFLQYCAVLKWLQQWVLIPKWSFPANYVQVNTRNLVLKHWCHLVVVIPLCCLWGLV